MIRNDPIRWQDINPVIRHSMRERGYLIEEALPGSIRLKIRSSRLEHDQCTLIWIDRRTHREHSYSFTASPGFEPITEEKTNMATDSFSSYIPPIEQQEPEASTEPTAAEEALRHELADLRQRRDSAFETMRRAVTTAADQNRTIMNIDRRIFQVTNGIDAVVRAERTARDVADASTVWQADA